VGETLLTLADGADLLLTGKGERGLAANVAEYYDIPLATLHFFPDTDSRLGGVIGGITTDAHFDNVMVVDAVNHAAVFPVCRAAVWASAVERLKVGAERVFSASTLDSLVADLRSILTPEYLTRAREVAAQMTKVTESASSAADLLEDAVQRRARADR
jgi:UDP:flavonoid glycosyltransferase YjiC (YdhE family)